LWGDTGRRLDAIERTLHGNGQPGVINQFHELAALGLKLDLSFKQQEKQHAQNRMLLRSILAGVLINFVVNHWAGIVTLLR
jgi:hypothetical protein